ncbi:MAG: hypothetical protein JWR72_3299 [Flavisolibacter sp.]|jgi:hypothetical protein|nr:hypothetical protein [Flavisolibacter sp.]
MKKVLLLAGIAITIYSCNSSIPPKQVAQEFIKAVASNDNTTAASLATDDTKATVSSNKSPQAQVPAEDQFDLGTLTETINGNGAVVNNKIVSVSLKKEGEGWRVSATPELLSIIGNRQANLAAAKQKWEALLKEYESRLQVAKSYVQYKKDAGILSPQLQKLDEVINSLTTKTAWNKETIALYRQKQNQLADLIDRSLEPSYAANSDLSMNYIIQLSNVKDRIKVAEGEYQTIVQK